MLHPKTIGPPDTSAEQVRASSIKTLPHMSCALCCDQNATDNRKSAQRAPRAGHCCSAGPRTARKPKEYGKLSESLQDLDR